MAVTAATRVTASWVRSSDPSAWPRGPRAASVGAATRFVTRAVAGLGLGAGFARRVATACRAWGFALACGATDRCSDVTTAAAPRTAPAPREYTCFRCGPDLRAAFAPGPPAPLRAPAAATVVVARLVVDALVVTDAVVAGAVVVDAVVVASTVVAGCVVVVA